MNKENLLALLQSHKEVLTELSEFKYGLQDDILETDLLIERVEKSYEDWKDKLVNLLEGLEVEDIEEMLEFFSAEHYRQFGEVFTSVVKEALK